jgi:hypothetical protein
MSSAERQPDAAHSAQPEQAQQPHALATGPIAAPAWGTAAGMPAMSPGLALQLQRSAGNAAVSGMIARQAAAAAAPPPAPTAAPVSVPTSTGPAAAGREQEVDSALTFIADYARRVPGYTLLTRAIGSDPITGQRVDSSTGAIVREIAAIVPGGTEMLQRLEQSGALDRAGAWLQQEIPALGLSYERISQLFQQAWDSISAWDLFDPAGAWDRLAHIFQGPVDRLIAFAERASEKLLEFALEAMLAAGGGASEQVMAILRRAGQAFMAIVRDPIGFARNLVNAVMSGFQGFLRNIGAHLQRGLIGWLTGALGGAIRLPERLDFEGIVSLVTQVLGLTWERIRERLVRMIGARRVAWLERSIDFVRDLVTRGPAAAWERILEFARGLADQVLDGIREWITESVVGAAIRRLVTMFNPAGAIINAVIAIYDTIQFVIERARQIGEFITSVADSIAEIASGAIGRAADAVEGALGRAVPLAIGFLADLIGLGNVGERVRGIIERIRETVDGAIDRLMEWIVARFSGRGRQEEAGAAAAEGAQPGAEGQQAPAEGAEAGAAAQEPAETTAVKERALTMVQERARRGGLQSMEAWHTLLQGIMGELGPQGLKGLSTRVDPKTLGITVSAHASVPQTATIRWNEVFSATPVDPQALEALLEQFRTGGPRGNETYAAAAVNGRLIGSGRNAADHAEQALVKSEDWAEALRQADEEGTADSPADLSLLLNRSPCSEQCAPFLQSWIRRNAREHPNVRFILAPSANYTPDINIDDLRDALVLYLDGTGRELNVPLGSLTRAQLEEILEGLELMDSVRTTGARIGVATSMENLRQLEGAGWELHQLQIRATQRPSEAMLAGRVEIIRREADEALEQAGTVGTPTT